MPYDWSIWFGSYTPDSLIGSALIGAAAFMPVVALRVTYRFGFSFLGELLRTFTGRR